MTIAAILNGQGGRSVATLSSSASVGDAVAFLAEHGIGAIPVVDDGAVVGIFSERDVIRLIAREGTEALAQPLSAAMTASPVTVRRDDAVIAALSLMTRRRIRHLPVVEDGALVGFVSIGDLVKYRIDRIEADATAMRDYIQQA
jgi:CBS domain-containing protein